MLGKGNKGEQVADDRIDYVDDESTIGAKGGLDHEDRLSSGELQCGPSQESLGVTRSSSISSGSVWYSASNDTANVISLRACTRSLNMVR